MAQKCKDLPLIHRHIHTFNSSKISEFFDKASDFQNIILLLLPLERIWHCFKVPRILIRTYFIIVKWESHVILIEGLALFLTAAHEREVPLLRDTKTGWNNLIQIKAEQYVK